jgi:hypothetical protein
LIDALPAFGLHERVIVALPAFGLHERDANWAEEALIEIIPSFTIVGFATSATSRRWIISAAAFLRLGSGRK